MEDGGGGKKIFVRGVLGVELRNTAEKTERAKDRPCRRGVTKRKESAAVEEKDQQSIQREGGVGGLPHRSPAASGKKREN